MTAESKSPLILDPPVEDLVTENSALDYGPILAGLFSTIFFNAAESVVSRGYRGYEKCPAAAAGGRLT
jgi:hypothetical protein